MAESHPAPPAPEQPSLIARFVATGAFSGYAPIAPGTAGSFVALCAAFIPGFTDPLPLAAAIIVAFAIGVPAAAALERTHGKDPSIVVIDEVIGMWIALYLLPKSVLSFVLAFLAFRFFDIIKPPPARRIEEVHGGWGIILDDVVAALYANLACQVIVRLVIALF